MSVEQRLAEGLRRAGVRSDQPCGAAVSGGADSTALLHLLVQAELPVHVLHVDHGLRSDSGTDARAVAAMAGSLGLPWTLLTARPPAGRLSPEHRARDLRYRLLGIAAYRLGLRWVLMGHTLDDQAETVLLRLMRGTSTRGTAGIPFVRDPFVRPLLDVRRDELRRRLTDRGVGWREDPTNTDQRFDRNWVRARVLPLMAERHPEVVSALVRHAEQAADDEEVLGPLAAEIVLPARQVAGATLVDVTSLRVPRALATRAVRILIERIGGRVDTATVDRVLALAGDPPGPAVVCGPGAEVRRIGDRIAFIDTTSVAPEPVRLPARGEVRAPGWGVRVRVSDSGEPWVWRCRLDDVRSGLWLRGRLPGDRVRTPGGTRKVQDVLVDAKIPRFARDRVAVLADGDVPLAVVGFTSPPSSPRDGIVVDAEPIEGAGWWTSNPPGIS